MNIAAMLRVRNEERWIRRAMDSLLPVAEYIWVLDDHSTDDTAAICRAYSKTTVYDSPFDHEPLDETQDKNWLLEKVSMCEPRWIICIDGDEEIVEQDTPMILQLAATRHILSWTFQVLYLWNDEETVRVDGVYGKFRRGSMFQWSKDVRFQATKHGGNFHCGNVPIGLMTQLGASDVRLLHYGYMHKEDRVRKWEWYNKHDPHNTLEDEYKHMVLGDMPQFPPNLVCRWGGPLTLTRLGARR